MMTADELKRSRHFYFWAHIKLSMDNVENNITIKKAHRLIVDGRKSFTVHGVTEVLEVAADFLSVRLVGEVLDIKGKSISIKKLAIEEGLLEAAGSADEIKYNVKRQKVPLLKRIFK